MRVLVATLRYPPYVAGGYELATRDAVRGLRARGHEVSVLCGRGARFLESDGVLAWLEPALPETGEDDDLFERARRGSNADRVRLHVLRTANAQAARRALARTGAEVLFFWNLGLASLGPVLGARLAGVPTLGYVTDPWPLNHWIREWRGALDGGAGKAAKLALLEKVWRAFRESVGLGPLLVSSAFLMRALARDGVDAASLERVPLALPADLVPARDGSGPRARGAGERLRVACTSMWWEGKGVHVLLEAAALAAAEGVDLELELAGSGPPDYRALLERLARAPSLEGRVRLRGRLERAEIAALLDRSHLLAFPSTWDEPFPLATIEAMAHGLPLATSDAGGTPEQIEPGVEGLVVPKGQPRALADALARFASDEPFRVACARAALRRVERELAPEVFVDRLEAALARAALGWS